MTPIESAKAKDQMCSMVPDTCTRFYVPGRLNYSTVQPGHKAILTSIVTALKLKPRKSPAEQALVAGYNKDIDGIDFTYLDPIVSWVTAG